MEQNDAEEGGTQQDDALQNPSVLKWLQQCAPERVPDIAVQLSNLVLLDISGRGIGSLPEALSESCQQLEILFCSNNHFQEMPAVIGRCPRLRMVAFKSNGIEYIHPEALQPQLQWLILTDNRLTSLPETIGRCVRLQKCMLSGNELSELPASMSACTKLELIRLASNQLTAPPLRIMQLPELRWIALSENPFLSSCSAMATPETKINSVTLPVLTDVDVTTGSRILGKGAGGVTTTGIWKGRTVAIKTFHSATMTSDGTPQAERRVACTVGQILAGHCPALIPVYGQTADTGALVMEYVPQVQPLANPPTFDTCSRDVYSTDLSTGNSCWTAAQAMHLVDRVLRAMTLLHQHGICHGDLYAHNILVGLGAGDQEKAISNINVRVREVRLSDFGAAFFYDKSPEAGYGAWLELIEIRSFAVLVEEAQTVLLASSPERDDQVHRETLRSLLALCRDERTTNFPQLLDGWNRLISAMNLAGAEE